jgi:hypothetical protein
MKPKQILKISVDFALLIALLFLMTYEMIGQASHEWLGVSMFTLLVVHHWLNLHWLRNLLSGHYTFYRTVQTCIVFGVLLAMLVSMLSGIILSQTLFTFIHFRGYADTARIAHMLSAYWGFILMGLHLGFHWQIFVKMLVKCFNKKSLVQTCLLRCLALTIVLYGIYTFQVHGFGRYMFLIDHFVFFDFSRPLYHLLLDYAAILAVPIAVGYYLAKFLLIVARKN